MKYFAIFIVLGSIGFSISEVIPFRNCSYPGGTSRSCTVHEVRINPCTIIPRAKDYCRFTRGQDVSMEFDYTAYFEGDRLESQAYWDTDVGSLPYTGMETNACRNTVCPVQPGKKQTYEITRFISKIIPRRIYDVKWRLWNPQGQECCFVIGIQVV